MAKQASERYNVKNYFCDANEMLEVAKPDIVHITTPAQSHYELGKLCLNAGIHVYIEKPFTVNAEEADELIRLAYDQRLKLTVGHDGQFDHAAMRMRELVKDGFLGGEPVHMESLYCYSFESTPSKSPFLGNKNHWVRNLPGKFLHNLISHGIARVAEYLQSDSPKVMAQGFRSPLLAEMNANDIIDELRVIIYDRNCCSAYFTFSCQINPKQIIFHIYGPQNSILVDHTHQTVIKMNNYKYKSYLNHFVPPLIFGRQHVANAQYNVKQFLKRNFHMSAGMKNLIRIILSFDPT